MDLRAELTANVWKITVSVGDTVAEGDTVAILESMKMEIPVESTVEGTITSIEIEEGGLVHESDIVAVVES